MAVMTVSERLVPLLCEKRSISSNSSCEIRTDNLPVAAGRLFFDPLGRAIM